MSRSMMVPNARRGQPGNVTLATNINHNLWDGSTLGSDGKFYAVSALETGNQVVCQWPDPTAPGTVNSQTFPIANPNCGSIVEDTVNSCFYIGCRVLSSLRVTIYKLVPGTMTVSTVVTNVSVAVGGTPIPGSSAICTDGTNVWVVICTSDVNTWIAKFRISDGTLINSIQMTNSPGGATNHGTHIHLVGSNIVAAGTGGGGVWTALMPSDLTTITTVVNIPGITQIDDDSYVIGTNVWYADESDVTPNSNVYKVSSDLLTITGYSTGRPGSTDGMFYNSSVSPYLWSMSQNDATVTTTNVSTGALVATYTDLVGWGFIPGGRVANEIAALPTGFIAYTSDIVGTSDSRVAYVHLA